MPFIYRFDDEGMGAVSKDVWLLTAGFSIVLVYVTVTIGNYSMIHHKVFELEIIYFDIVILIFLQHKSVIKLQNDIFKRGNSIK